MWHALANGMFADLALAEDLCLIWPLGWWSQKQRPMKLTWTQLVQNLKQSHASQPGSEKNKYLRVIATEIWGGLYAPRLQQWLATHRCLRKSLESEVFMKSHCAFIKGHSSSLDPSLSPGSNNCPTAPYDFPWLLTQSTAQFLVVSLHLAHTTVKCLFIKHDSSYPIWVCHLFPAWTLT